nr:unnamed protein product [Callosobruchus analis]
MNYVFIFMTLCLPVTKRNVLSLVARIFDPIRLLSPIIILLKILMPCLWSLNLNWDAILPNHLYKFWQRFHTQLAEINNLKVSRHTLNSNPIQIELHGFSDASQNAYSDGFYLTSLDHEGNVDVQLLCSKTIVAPTKQLTIPRLHLDVELTLELCGSLLLANLYKTVKGSLTINFNTYFWCDSQIMLYWINSDPSSLQTLVANRVSQIRSLTRPSGPSFLKGCTNWPEPFNYSPNVKIPEIKKHPKTFICTEDKTFNLFDTFFNLTTPIRTFSYCLRFISISKKTKELPQFGSLSTTEFNNSLLMLAKIA